VGADESCNNAVLGVATFVREDARRTAPTPDAQNALAVPRFQFVLPPTDSGSGYGSGRRLPLEERPLVIALRI
jgi:hypothetical protein